MALRIPARMKIAYQRISRPRNESATGSASLGNTYPELSKNFLDRGCSRLGQWPPRDEPARSFKNAVTSASRGSELIAPRRVVAIAPAAEAYITSVIDSPVQLFLINRE